MMISSIFGTSIRIWGCSSSSSSNICRTNIVFESFQRRRYMFTLIEVSSCSCSSSSCSSSWSLLKNCITINFCSCYNSNATTLCVNNRIAQRRISKRQFSIDNTIVSLDPNPSVLNTTRANTIKIAIVGSGPSGCYTAKYLSKALQQQQQHDETKSENTTENEHGCSNAIYPQQSYQIDIIEKLPTPYGLVRYGVAPDHPEVKNVQNDFDQLFDNTNYNYNNHIHFIGNVHVGRDILLEELRQFYTIVILCYGCDSDRKLVLPTTTTTTTVSSIQSSSSSHDHDDDNNSATTMFLDTHHPSLPSDDFIMSAREFVAWYNGHPHYDHIGPKLVNILKKSSSSTTTGTNVVIFGHGNVALDCARILAKGGTKEFVPLSRNDDNDVTTSTANNSSIGGLYDTDIATRAYNVLQEYPVSHISIVGRRGHVQASFTIKEVRELVNLEKDGYDVSFIVRNDELDMCTATTATQEELNGPNGRPKTRIDKLLREAAAKATNAECKRTVQLRFLMNPVRLETCATDPTSLLGVVCERNTLTGEAGKQRAIGTGNLETVPASLVLVSIGYKGIPIPGIEEWFDEESGTIRNDRGRVELRTTQLGGLYTSGWIKRGPSGIIGTNISDAKETVATIMTDLANEPVMSSCKSVTGIDGMTDIRELLKIRGIPMVDWHGYRRIELKESTIRRSKNQPREKIVKLEDQLAVALLG